MAKIRLGTSFKRLWNIGRCDAQNYPRRYQRSIGIAGLSQHLERIGRHKTRENRLRRDATPEIMETLKVYRIQEEQLLSQLKAAKSHVNPITSEVTKGIVGELAATAAEEFFGLRSLGRKVGRAFVAQGDRQNSKNIQQAIENQHKSIVTSVLGLLSSVSERVGGTLRQNSNKLMRKISHAQGFTRLETRILKTIAELQVLETADLVYNRDIMISEQDKSSRILERMPRISAVRAMLPEIEPRLRKFVRTSLTNSLGPGWQTDLSAKFPKEFVRRTEKAHTKGSTDPLDGQTFGEMIQTVRSFPELNKLVSSRPELHLSLNILSSARFMFIHPLKTHERDLQENDFRKIILAMETVIDSLSTTTRSN